MACCFCYALDWHFLCLQKQQVRHVHVKQTSNWSWSWRLCAAKLIPPDVEAAAVGLVVFLSKSPSHGPTIEPSIFENPTRKKKKKKKKKNNAPKTFTNERDTKVIRFSKEREAWLSASPSAKDLEPMNNFWSKPEKLYKCWRQNCLFFTWDVCLVPRRLISSFWEVVGLLITWSHVHFVRKLSNFQTDLDWDGYNISAYQLGVKYRYGKSPIEIDESLILKF